MRKLLCMAAAYAAISFLLTGDFRHAFSDALYAEETVSGFTDCDLSRFPDTD